MKHDLTRPHVPRPAGSLTHGRWAVVATGTEEIGHGRKRNTDASSIGQLSEEDWR
jgi:hypothetical protein